PADYGVGGSAGRGGGAVKLTAGELKLDGSIQADGSSVTSSGGAGSGGSVWLRANTLSGAGAISASGGNGRSGNYGSGGGGGRIAVHYLNKTSFDSAAISASGGAGGYSSNSGADGTIYWGQSQLPTRIISAQPGNGAIVRHQITFLQVQFLTEIDATSFSTDDVALTGPSGPIPIVGVGSANNRNFQLQLAAPLIATGLYRLQVGPALKGNTGLPMDQNDNGVGGEAIADQFTATFKLQIADVVVDEDLFISESDPSYRDKVIVVENGTLTVDGSYDFKAVQLKPGTRLTGVKAELATDPKATWQFESLIVDEGALIDISGLGLSPTGDVDRRSAGSHGGAGSFISDGKTNRVFGSEFEPEEYGIGGRGIDDGFISYGGGALKLVVGELKLSGDIRANGGFAPTNTAGASGGSIWIETDRLEGTGKISADGSVGGLVGANGGGGRISLTYREAPNFNSTEQLSVVGGTSTATGSGSIYVHQSDHSTSVRKIHLNPIHADASGRIALEFSEELDMATFTAEDVKIMDGSGEIVQVLSVGKESDHRYWVQSQEMLPDAHYQIRIGPDITAVSGVGMDQNKDGIVGEQENDVFVFDFEIFAADQVITETSEITPENAEFRNKRILVDGGTLKLNGDYEFESLRVAHSGQVVAYEDSTSEGAKVSLKLSNELIIDEGASISLTGSGFGPVDGQLEFAGGSHGGKGGKRSTNEPLPQYGDVREPETLGQGGRYSSATYWSKGGGALKIESVSTTVNGTIEAHGGRGSHNNSPGGAGGSIWLTTQTLAMGENSQIGANGGYSRYSGTGGGGRVALYYEAYTGGSLEDALTASTGTGNYADRRGSAGTLYLQDTSTDHSILRIDNKGNRDGSWSELDALPEGLDELHLIGGRIRLSVEAVPGVFVIDNAEVELTVPKIPSLTASNGSFVILAADQVDYLEADNSTITQASALVVDEQVLSNGSVWQQSGQDLTVTGRYDFQQSDFIQHGTWNRPEGSESLTVSSYELAMFGNHTFDRLVIGSGGVIKTYDYDPKIAQTGTLDLNVNELFVAEGGKLSATGSGYGPISGQPNYAGGSHGGMGGEAQGIRPLPSYGNVLEPETLGQGGRFNSTSRWWSKGGGALKIRAVSSTINGVLEAHGVAGDTGYSTGGAGGSIWLTTQTLALGENGQIGANGGYSEKSGTGGGGRVALYYNTYTGRSLENVLTASAGTSNNADLKGSAGTLYWQDTNTGHSVLRIDNKGARGGSWSELDALPEGLDELHLIGGRMRLSVEAMPAVFVINNAEVELTVPEISSLVVTNGSAVAVESDQVDYLESDSSTITQASALVVLEQRLLNGSVWNQNGQELTVTNLYDIQQSDFVQDGVWNRPEGNESLTVSGYKLTLFGHHTFNRLEIGSNGAVTTRGYSADIAQTGSLHLEVNELIVSESGTLSATGAGYGPVEGQPDYVGGSHAGTGGPYSNSAPLAGYGDAREPVTLGQGGRYSSESRWSKGGGALRVEAVSVRIDGTIQAHGGKGSHNSSPGGAGGSIWLTTQTLVLGENGQIGANGGYSRYTGTGGGGRVAIYYATSLNDSFEQSITVNPGSGGSTGTQGGAGSIVIEQQQSPTAVQNVSLNEVNSVALDGFDVWFSNEIDPASFTIEDIAITGPDGAVGVSQVIRIDPVNYYIGLAQPPADGFYQLSIGPDVQSIDGYGMDQNENGVTGEVDDVYVFNFTIDTQPPSPVQLTSHQPGASYELDARRINLAGIRNENSSIWINGSMRVSMGAGPWQVSALALNEGDNEIVLMAVDEASNHSDWVGLNVNVDSIAPTKTGQSPSLHTNESPSVITIGATDDGSGLGLAGTSITVKRGGVTIAGSLSLNGDSFVFTPAGQLLEGSYSVTSRLADQRGNVSGNYGGSFVLDFTAPGKPSLQPYPETTSSKTYTFQGAKEADTSLMVGGESLDIALSSTAWSYTVDLAQGENTFTFQLRDRAGNLSEPVLATINFDDTAPGPVVPVMFADGDGHTIKLDWSSYDEVANGNDIGHYRVFVQTSPFAEVSGLTPYAYLPLGIRTLDIVDLQRNVPVYVAVVAQDTSGLMLDRVPSAEVTPVDVVPPENVSQLTVAPTATSLALRWPPVADDEDLAGYRVYIEKAGATETHDLDVSALTMSGGKVALELETLEPATTYPLKVTSYDNDGNESVGVTNPGVTLLVNPASLTTEPFSGKVGLEWSAAQPAELVRQYNVYASTGDFTSVSGMAPKATVERGRLDVSVAGLTNGTKYYFSVTAVNLSGGEDKQVVTVEATPTDDAEGPEIIRVTYFDGIAEQELTEGDSVTRNGSIRVYAEDPSGLSRFELTANGSSLGDDFTANPAFEVPWNLINMEDGQYQLVGEVFDTLNNSTEVSLAVNVALEPPAAPEITSPKAGTVTNQPSVTLQGQSVRNADIRVTVNGVTQPDTLATNAQGAFTGTITLSEGENVITAEAAYANRGAYGAGSAPVIVTLDSAAPDAPQGLTATSKPLGQIALAWSAVEGAKGYHIYRDASAFSDVQQATRITGKTLNKTTYQDLPVEDGTYYYRAVSVNDLGTQSEPSQPASAEADSTAPQAVEIRYTPQGNQDQLSGRTGPGRVDIEVSFSEPLKTKPYLAFTVSGGMPMVAEIQRSYASDTLYSGSFVIKETSLSGTAMAVLSAHDEVGNRGTDVVEGKTLVIDTQGPEVANLQLNPSAPIKNEPDDNGLGQEVEVVMTLADDVKPGELPTLIPFISDGVTEQTITDYSNGIILTMDGSSQPGAPVYSGRFRLPLSAGQDENGEPAAEQIGFQYTAQDDLGNQVARISGNPRFQVYQGDLPPLQSPVGLTARALPGGKVELTWSAVESAAGYKLYRQTPAESELSELVELSYPEEMRYIDGNTTGLADGTYQYAIASVRAQNGETSESALSDTVEVNVDGTAPDAPENLLLELNGAGIVARWQPPASEAQDGLLKYNLYRLDMPAGSTPADMEGVTPLQNGIPDIIALDSRPSATEHLYVVTAVDKAGNESVPSNSQYLNVDLLPVSDLRISLEEQGRPALFWNHAKASAVSFDVFEVTGSEVRKLNSSLLDDRSFEDLDYNNGLPVSGAPQDRLYRVVAVDQSDVNSIGHDLLLPALRVSLVGEGAGTAINRGVMNQVKFRVTNSGGTNVVQARLKVTLMENGNARAHWSERFTIAQGGFNDVPVVIGGYDKLPTLATMDLQIVLEPKPGQRVSIQQQEEVVVGQSALVATLETEEFVRGATGKVRVVLENPSAVETEVLMATGSGKKDSTEVRLVLKDVEGNTLSSQAIRQVTGDVVSLNNGDTIARIPANGSYRSQAFEVVVPSTAPDNVRVHLEVDRFRYHTGRDTFVAIEGTRASMAVSLEETPYYGEINQVAPAKLFVGETVSISGQAIDRENTSPLGNVPLTLVLTSRGFERTFPVYTGADGSFEYRFTPGASESGAYRVSILHPRMVERPEHGSFTVEGAGVTPTQARLTIPRNYEYGLDVRVRAGHATELQNVRLEYAPSTDSEGQPLPAPDGMVFDPGAARQIGANQSAYLKLKFRGDTTAADSGTLRFHILEDNRDKPLDTLTVEYFLTEAKPILLSLPSLVNTGVGLGSSQQENISLKNTGLETAHNLQVSLVDENGQPAPDWFKLLTPANPGNLPVGEQADIRIAVSPGTSVQPGDYFFKVRVEGDNASALEVPVLVAATNSGTGGVFFHTTDIYTATLDENMEPIPGLGKVKIKLQNTQVLSEVFELTTDSNGYGELTDIPAGRYSYRASAFDHESVSGHLWVKPGVTTQEQLFLMNQLINVEFSVTEITLEDRYDIVLKATYETNVPVPVVLFEPMSVNLPMLAKGEVFQGEFTITNYGLIEAYDVKANLPTGDDFARFDYLVEIPDTIQPGQVVRVPYRIVALQDFLPSGDGEATGGGCVRRNYKAVCTYSAECAVGTIIDNAATMIWNAISGSSCGGSGGSGGSGGFYGGGYFGGGGGGTNYSPAPPSQITVDDQFCPEDCVECCGNGSGGSGAGGVGGGLGGSSGLGAATGVPQGGF
ncbi:MAG: fibronectin type 3 domain-containing protein, partial [Pseudomonadales bacterium]